MKRPASIFIACCLVTLTSLAQRIDIYRDGRVTGSYYYAPSWNITTAFPDTMENRI